MTLVEFATMPPDRHALIVCGGWDGHQPALVAQLFREILCEEGWQVEIADTLDAFRDESRLKSLDLIVPIWTMGKIESDQLRPVLSAVESGVGLAGCHGGMCDSFRDSTEWQFMTGGQWVAHPGNDGIRYTVNIKDREHQITKGIDDFEVCSEQYYMHIDPAINVLATTRFPTPGVSAPHEANGIVHVPVIWTKMWGNGKVFYCSLGHQRDVVEAEPARTIMKRGFMWAAK